MSHVTYRILRHDDGWAYKVNGVFSEPARARHAVGDQRFAPVVPFLNQALAHGKPVTPDGGAAIRAHAHLRERAMSRANSSAFARAPPLGVRYSHNPICKHSSAGTLR